MHFGVVVVGAYIRPYVVHFLGDPRRGEIVDPCGEIELFDDELCERGVLTAILRALDFIPQDVLDQIKEGVPLNAGPVLRLDA